VGTRPAQKQPQVLLRLPQDAQQRGVRIILPRTFKTLRVMNEWDLPIKWNLQASFPQSGLASSLPPPLSPHQLSATDPGCTMVGSSLALRRVALHKVVCWVELALSCPFRPTYSWPEISQTSPFLSVPCPCATCSNLLHSPTPPCGSRSHTLYARLS